MRKASPSKKAKKIRAKRRSLNLGVLREILGFRLRRIQNHLAETFVAGLAGSDIKPGEFSALAIIAANPGISQIELSREGGFDKASIVFLIDDLELWGWAKRKRSTIDRRRHSLFITPTGSKALSELFSAVQKNEERIHNVLSDRELKILFGMLDRIYTKCFGEDERAS